MNSLGIDKEPKDTRVVVAMSGGVDSSVVACMMKEEGYDVIGVTLQLYDHGIALEKSGACCAGQDIYDARTVADRYGFPHYILDYESRFKQDVMEDFADSYMRGETPIPCVRCNQKVKFKDMLAMAKDLGADVMATGHYVQRIDGPNGPELHRAFDYTKDQTYFLFTTTEDQLDFLRFPLGGLPKTETRKIAERMGLSVADKPDSQDICFVPDGSYARVVERLRPGALDKGDIVHLDGTVLGQHDGIINYTVGQRRGIGVGGTSDPIYVIRLDAEKKQVIVGPKEALSRDVVLVNELNWLAEPLTDQGREVTVKLRSASKPTPATVYPEGQGLGMGGARVVLHDPLYGISPGQAAVFYDGDRVLGGGWIVSTEKQVLDEEAQGVA
ncbi:tRNA 2-thiouridine(34) synthase MnmA [Kiloniella sp. EL199]|uniref:tRNA 2-thiouridine(34) synthase MnmA n=1 Tax=Kiloniella sp. EL199 TaxID=2107581 RepID=UPI000EA37B42|nr:tRNA 2-thiouridine(34) synthase MnmA [Kiloniella sp. EL199]